MKFSSVLISPRLIIRRLNYKKYYISWRGLTSDRGIMVEYRFERPLQFGVFRGSRGSLWYLCRNMKIKQYRNQLLVKDESFEEFIVLEREKYERELKNFNSQRKK